MVTVAGNCLSHLLYLSIYFLLYILLGLFPSTCIYIVLAAPFFAMPPQDKAWTDGGIRVHHAEVQFGCRSKKTQRFCGKGLDISGVYDGNTLSSQLTSPFSRGKACVNRQSISIATYVSLPKAKGYISIPRWIAIDIESMEDDGKILAPVEFISLAHYF